MELHEIEEKVKSIIEKATSDKEFHEELKKNPIKAVEDLLGTDLPDEQIKAIVETVKQKLSLSDGIENVKEKLSIGDEIENVKEKLEGLFHKE